MEDESSWREVRLTLLMWTITCFVAVGLILLTLFVVMPAIGVDPSSGVNPREEPLQAARMLVCGLVFASIAAILGCSVASWVALKYFTRDEVRSEYLRLMWLPKSASFNGRIFDTLFKPTHEAAESTNSSAERAREK